MIKTIVYLVESLLGEVDVYSENDWLNNNEVMMMMMGVMRISHYSQASERCPPLAVLHTITSGGVCFKMESSNKSLNFHQQEEDSPLLALHSTCLKDNKTAVVPHGKQEIHLVAMRPRRRASRTPCFWGFRVASGLYDSCLGLLNLRCLGIVFDLDETLIVANTMRSFEDKIEALQRKISVETDPQRLAGMMAEVKSYQDDKAILKQYAETDQVVENGKVHKIQAEVVPAFSGNHQTLVRPLIRLREKNTVLTRINPQIRDTSVLVKLRPAWEDLRSYLIAKGRKRFEVYVCTMAERDYALEMWRLLDPDSNLISTRELLDRIVCVKSGSKKSLFDVFHDGLCHPRMALVIDDRLKVWDEKDRPRVHVVPAYSPYFAPQAEANYAIPVLCMARNVACNIRGGFFKDFDEGLLRQIFEVAYEDDLNDIPSSPDVSSYLVSEDDGYVSNGIKEPLCYGGMADVESERRLKDTVLNSSAAFSLPFVSSSSGLNFGPRLASSLPLAVANSPNAVPQPASQAPVAPYSTRIHSQTVPSVIPLGNIGHQDLSLHHSPAREEGEVPDSELDPDTRRRLLILQHGQDTRDNLPNELPFPSKPPVRAPVSGPGSGSAPLPVPGPGPGPGPVPVSGPVSQVQSRGIWLPVEDHMIPGPLHRVAKEFPSALDAVHTEKQRPPPSLPREMQSSTRSDQMFSKKQKLREAIHKDDRLRANNSLPSHKPFQGDQEFEVEHKRESSLSESPAGALYDIAVRCGTKVAFRTGLVATTELKFSVEALFAGERISEGTGVSRRKAQEWAAEAALMNLADRYLTHMKSDPSTPQRETSRDQSLSEIGVLCDGNLHDDLASVKEETVPSSELTIPDSLNVDDSKNSITSVSTLKESGMREGWGIDFRAPSPASTNLAQKTEIYAEAAGKAFGSPESMLGQFTQKRSVSPRSQEGIPSKRPKLECPQVLQRMPSSRYPKNLSPVP